MPSRALDPRRAPARPLRVGPDRRGRAPNLATRAHRPAPARPARPASRSPTATPWPSWPRRIDANVRQLHGALTRVDRPRLAARPSRSAPSWSPRSSPPASPRARPSVPRRSSGRSPNRFGVARRRARRHAAAPPTPLRARQVAIYLTRELTDLSLPQIGRLYGGRDHSTVLNSMRRVEAAQERRPRAPPRGSRTLRATIHSPAGEALRPPSPL